MNTLRTVLLGGLRDARRLRLALPLYLTGLVFGLLQTWPVVFGVASGRANQLDLEQLLVDSDALVNLLFQSDTATVTAYWLLLLPLLSLAYGLAYNLFSGGIVSVWNGTRRFWGGCRRFFLAFTGLGVLLVVVALLVIGLASALVAGAGLLANVTTIGSLIVLQLLNLVGEYARAIGIVRDRRNPFVLFGRAFSFCVRHPATLLFGLAGVLAQVGLAAAYLGLSRLIGTSPLGIVLDQGLVFAWLAVKLLRLAWARQYVSVTERSSDSVSTLATPGDAALA